MEEERSALRRQARDWLQADLDQYAALIKDGKAQAALKIPERLRHWQQDSDLARVRDPNELSKLPEVERRAWRDLWAAVESLRQRTTEKKE